MPDFGPAYEATRLRIVGLVEGLADGDLGSPVPACPGWSVHDLVAHVTGIATDILEGRYEGVGRDDWTRAQVEARRDMSIQDVLDEWGERAPKVEELLDDVFHPAIAALTLADVVTHEQDLRGALGQPGARDSLEFRLALEAYARTVGRNLKKTDLPALGFSAGDGLWWTLGNGEPAGEVTGDAFELYRTMGGRRTRDEARALVWSLDPEPYLDHFCLYTYRGEPLGE